jgi:hypothetical protein
MQAVCGAPWAAQYAKRPGETRTGTVLADSTAALAIADRKRSGKLRHINVSLLCIQEKESKEELAFEKVLGTENLAGMMTKNLDALKIAKFSNFKAGRSKEGLKVQKTGNTEGRVVIAWRNEVEVEEEVGEVMSLKIRQMRIRLPSPSTMTVNSLHSEITNFMNLCLKVKAGRKVQVT